MKTIDANNLPSSIYNGIELTEDQIKRLDESYNLPYEDKVVGLLEIEDAFGSDYILQFEGKMILTDRNCGMYVYVDERSYKDLLLKI